MKTLGADKKPCRPDDSNRLVWYSIACGYWTDDFDKLSPWREGSREIAGYGSTERAGRERARGTTPGPRSEVAAR
jgi:hypothetical protein